MLRFGEMPTSKALRIWLAGLHEAPQLVVDAAGGWNEPTRHAVAMIRADEALLAAGFAERVEAADSGWRARWLEAGTAAADAAMAAMPGDELSEPAVHRALAGAYRDGDVVYTA